MGKSRVERFLIQVNELDEEIEEKIKEKNREISIRGIAYDSPMVTTSKSSTSSVESFVLRNDEIISQILKLTKKRDYILSLIEKLPEEDEQRILHSYAINGNYKKIAYCFDRKSFTNTKESALKHFEEILQNLT